MKQQVKRAIVIVFLIAIIANILLFLRAIKLQSSPLVDRKKHWKATTLVKQKEFSPYRLAISREGTIYATDQRSDCLWKWNSELGLRRIREGLKKPTSVAVNDTGEIWIVNRNGREILRFVANNAPQMLNKPNVVKNIHDIAFDSYRGCFVALDRRSRKILSVNKSARWEVVHRAPLLSFGKGFGRAYSLTAGEEGKLYVLDFENCIMTIFPDGTGTKSAPKKKGVFTWGMIGDIAYHPTIGLVIADNRNKRILRMTVSDHIFETISDWRSGISNPTGVAISSDGTIYICDPKAGAIISLKEKTGR